MLFQNRNQSAKGTWRRRARNQPTSAATVAVAAPQDHRTQSHVRRHRGRESQRRSHPGQPQPRATRLARYCARHPVALGRLAYRADTGAVTYQSDQASGPTAGAETVDALEFLARVVSDIPNKGQVLQRYYGWYANRTRGIRRRAGVPEPAPAVAAEAVLPALAQARQRWAELLRRIFEVAPLRGPRCGHAMRIVGCITQPRVIDRILAHLRRSATPARRPRAPPRRRTAPRTPTSA
ncbi:MAG: transposase [Gemmatimonadetes bacterium]|nr:transposase [Gemmatimonadota bacterium]